MEDAQPELRPCAHCGGTIAADETTCADCGRPYIPAVPARPDAPAGEPSWQADDGGRAPVLGSSGRLTPESRNWAMAAHLSALAGVLLGGIPAFLGPLIIWLLRRDAGDPFVTGHARNALNFNLSVIIYVVVAVLLTIVTLGLALLVVLPLALVAFIGYLVVTIRAALAASLGEEYRYPLTIALVR